MDRVSGGLKVFRPRSWSTSPKSSHCYSVGVFRDAKPPQRGSTKLKTRSITFYPRPKRILMNYKELRLAGNRVRIKDADRWSRRFFSFFFFFFSFLPSGFSVVQMRLGVQSTVYAEVTRPGGPRGYGDGECYSGRREGFPKQLAGISADPIKINERERQRRAMPVLRAKPSS